MQDALEPDTIHAALRDTSFAEMVHILPCVESTNSYAMRQGANGAPHGSVYVAEEQTAGRGRGAHAWHSEPRTGLYISVLLRPQMNPADALWLSLASGLAVQQSIQAVTGLVVDIRWPNDLLLGTRKVAGILTEMHAEMARVHYGVVGIGINVNQKHFPTALSNIATSLYLESNRISSRQNLLISTLKHLHASIDKLIQPGCFTQATKDIVTSIEQNSTWIRKKHVFVDEAGGYTGITAGLDHNGFLRVQTFSGDVRIVLSGGVRENTSTYTDT